MTLVKATAIAEHNGQHNARSNEGANLQMPIAGMYCERLNRRRSEHIGEHFGMYAIVMLALANSGYHLCAGAPI